MTNFDVGDHEVVLEKDGVSITLDIAEFRKIATEFFCQQLNTDNISIIDSAEDFSTVVEFDSIECANCGDTFEDCLTIYVSDIVESPDIKVLNLNR